MRGLSTLPFYLLPLLSVCILICCSSIAAQYLTTVSRGRAQFHLGPLLLLSLYCAISLPAELRESGRIAESDREEARECVNTRETKSSLSLLILLPACLKRGHERVCEVRRAGADEKLHRYRRAERGAHSVSSIPHSLALLCLSVVSPLLLLSSHPTLHL